MFFIIVDLVISSYSQALVVWIYLSIKVNLPKLYYGHECINISSRMAMEEGEIF